MTKPRRVAAIGKRDYIVPFPSTSKRSQRYRPETQPSGHTESAATRSVLVPVPQKMAPARSRTPGWFTPASRGVIRLPSRFSPSMSLRTSSSFLDEWSNIYLNNQFSEYATESKVNYSLNIEISNCKIRTP